MFRRLLIFAGFLIAVIFLLMLVFGRSNRSTSSNLINATKVFDIVDYIDRDSYVTAKITGPINGDDQHNEVLITITPNSRTLDIIQGYQGKVIKSHTFANNRQAYTDFLNALEKQAFGKSRKTNLVKEGSCATGRIYTFEVFNNSELINETWSGSCTKGNAIAPASNVLNLFKKQITDYSKLTTKLNI